MKRLLRALCPDEIYPSVYAIDYKRLWRSGYRALIFDIDNTLGEWGCSVVPESAYALVSELSSLGFAVGFLSNNSGEDRSQLKVQLGSWPVLWRAGKPRIRGYKNILTLLRAKETEAVMIGDQLFTDIWGAKRAGLYAILVAPVSPASDSLWAKLRRPAERLLLKLFSRENSPRHYADDR